jgi:hypothetical protein
MIRHADWGAWVERFIQGLAMAAVLGGGGLVFTNKLDNVRQDVEHEAFRSVIEEIRLLDTQLSEANQNLAILNDRAERAIQDE